jgi:hypothetical protein
MFPHDATVVVAGTIGKLIKTKCNSKNTQRGPQCNITNNNKEGKLESVSKAHHVMQVHIHHEQATLECLQYNLDRVAQLAMARYQCKNNLGAIMSMRKYHKMLVEYERQTNLLLALQQLDHDLSHDVVPVDRYQIILTSILEKYTPSSTDPLVDGPSSSAAAAAAVPNDHVLLNELSSNDFMQCLPHQRRYCEQKKKSHRAATSSSIIIANPAA